MFTGDNEIEGNPVGFKGSLITKVVEGTIIESGDFLNADQIEIKSLYEESLEISRNLDISHSRAGMLGLIESDS